MSREPQRIQRSRAKGWRMPKGAIYVGRTNGHSPWANPFKIGGYFMIGDSDPRAFLRMAWMQTFRDPPETGFTRIVDTKMAFDWFRILCKGWTPAMLERCRSELGGHDLACWCRLDQPCHADVLLELANPAPQTGLVSDRTASNTESSPNLPDLPVAQPCGHSGREG